MKLASWTHLVCSKRDGHRWALLEQAQPHAIEQSRAALRAHDGDQCRCHVAVRCACHHAPPGNFQWVPGKHNSTQNAVSLLSQLTEAGSMQDVRCNSRNHTCSRVADGGTGIRGPACLTSLVVHGNHFCHHSPATAPNASAAPESISFRPAHADGVRCVRHLLNIPTVLLLLLLLRPAC